MWRVALGAIALAVAGAQPAHAQPAAKRSSGPVIECEVVEQAGYASARYRISNPGDAPVGYRFVAVIDNGGHTWSSDPIAGTLEPGAGTVHEFRSFPQGAAIGSCAAAVLPTPAVTRAEPEPILFEDVSSDVLHSHRAFGGLVLGGLGGIGLAWAGVHVGKKAECLVVGGCDTWIFDGTGGAAVVGLMGYVIGTTIGVGLAWDHAGASNPYGAAFGGVLLGGMFGLTAAFVLHDEGNDDAAAGVLLAAPLLGATVLVALTHDHHPNDELAIGTFVELREGEFVMGVPVPLRATVDGATVTTLPLLGGHF